MTCYKYGFCLSFVVILLVASAAAGQTPGQIDYAALYKGGEDYSSFLDTAVKRRAMWLRNTENARVPDELAHRLGAVHQSYFLLVVAVDACSDSANIIPYLARMAMQSRAIDLRIIDSDIGKPITLANRTPDDRPATPTIAVLDHEFNPIGFFIERPDELQEWALENKSKLSSEEYLDKKFEWYDKDLGRSSMAEVLAIIEASENSE